MFAAGLVPASASAHHSRAPYDMTKEVVFTGTVTKLDWNNPLCLAPQCGFASTEEGNRLTEDGQWAKLERIVEVAEEVWAS